MPHRYISIHAVSNTFRGKQGSNNSWFVMVFQDRIPQPNLCMALPHETSAGVSAAPWVGNLSEVSKNETTLLEIPGQPDLSTDCMPLCKPRHSRS